MLADLHTHTTASDGTVAPDALVADAAAAGIGLLAITDHDTLAAWETARDAAQSHGVALIPGVELSSAGAPGKCHLLGLGFDPDDVPLRDTLARLSASRAERNRHLLARLNALGVPITDAEVRAQAPGGFNVGRPLFAAALVARGAVLDTATAFRKYLADHAAAYVGRDSLAPEEAIRLIHAAGGLCFLAHPYQVRLAQQESIATRFRALRALGIDGIEAYYSTHTPAQEDALLRLAEKEGALVTGGSDFHGAHKPDIALGRVRDGGGLDSARLPEALRALARVP